ncbi:MAG: hypothetical protein IKA53_01235 [Clostridia bacterium]|nr:hypothetical protein [Clostridia bacterium]
MTYKQLYAEVAALGFEGEIENQPALLFSANRALKSLAALMPAYGTVTLIQRAFTPLSHIPELNYVPGKEITVPLRGAVFSFKFSGAGTVTLKERHRVSPFFMDSPYTEFRKYLLDGEGELVLSGNIAFTIKDLACFPYVLGTSEADIPLIAPHRSYDMFEHTRDFFGFTTLPTDEHGRTIAGSYFRDETLFIPSDYEGEIHLIYHRVPREITSDAPNAPIDLSPSMTHLLALLTAAYLWIDDDSAKSQFYMQMYMEGVRDLRIRRPSAADTAIVDTHHWA